MAAVIRYINTASTAGGDGTTNATSGANRAYPSMAAWYTAEKTDLVSDGDTHTVRCAAGIDSAGAIVISSSDWTTDATHFITIEPVSGDEHGGVYGEGYIFSTSTGGYTQAFYLSVPYTVIRGITIKNTSTSSNARCVHNNAHCTWDSCFFSAAASSGDAFYNGADDGGYVINCCAVSGYCGFRAFNYDYPTWLNNTAVGCTYGFRREGASGTLQASNNVAYGNATADFSGASVSGSNNASGDSSAPGTSPVTGVTSAAFNNYAGGDYSPASGGVLVGAGTDLSGTFTNDIAGNTRSAWDIGAWEYIAAGGGFQSAWARGSNQILGGFNP